MCSNITGFLSYPGLVPEDVANLILLQTKKELDDCGTLALSNVVARCVVHDGSGCPLIGPEQCLSILFFFLKTTSFLCHSPMYVSLSLCCVSLCIMRACVCVSETEHLMK